MTDRAKLKALWIAVARAAFNPGKRQPCDVCGKFEYIAQAHHVIPLGVQFDACGGFQQPDHEHVWLCPNHHAIIHVLIDGNPGAQIRGRRAAPILADLDQEQPQKMFDLVSRSGSVGA